MNRLSKKNLLLAISLSALAGCVDAIGFLQLGGYFISFMSDNSTQLAVGLMEGNWRPVTLLLAGAALCQKMGWNSAAIALMTLAMGTENAAFQRGGEVVIGLTYMTGTLVKTGQRIAQAMLGGAAFAWVPYLLLWLGLIGGGAAGGTAVLFPGAWRPVDRRRMGGDSGLRRRIR